MKALLLCLCACFCLFSCKKEEPEDIFIRVRNASQYPLENIVVKFRDYGSLSVGQSSDYQPLQVSNSLPTVTLVVQGQARGFTSVIDGPEGKVVALEAGRYTYVLNVVKTPTGENSLVVTREKP
jgi:hypothetical protein